MRRQYATRWRGAQIRLQLSVGDALNLGIQTLHARDWQYAGLVRIVPGTDRLDRFFDSIDASSSLPVAGELRVDLSARRVLRGVWVIATDGGGIMDDLTDGVSTTIIGMDDAAALREAVSAIMDRPGDFPGTGLVRCARYRPSPIRQQN